jgi:hypothetical protein
MVNAPDAGSALEQEGVRSEFAWFKQDVVRRHPAHPARSEVP